MKMIKASLPLKTYKNVIFSFALVATLLLSGCDDDDPEATNEEELITTVSLIFQEASGTPVTFTWKDADGSGSNAPVVDNITLKANTTYNFSIAVLDESNPQDPEDITEEIQEEAEEHQFFFSIPANTSVSYQDEDNNGYPVGLSNTLTTTTPANGTFTVTLRHQPDKNAAGVKDGHIVNAGGETDVEVTFNISIN